MTGKKQTPVKQTTMAKPEEKGEAVAKGLVLKHIDQQGAVVLLAALRAAGVTVQVKTAALIYEVVLGYLAKGDDLSLKDISKLVARIASNPDFDLEEVEK